jgi:hypothetical protein
VTMTTLHNYFCFLHGSIIAVTYMLLFKHDNGHCAQCQKSYPLVQYFFIFGHAFSCTLDESDPFNISVS